MKEIIIALILASLMGVISFWIGSFAKDKDIDSLNHKVENLEKKIPELAPLHRINSIDSRLSNILVGLCIIDKKTCGLKESQ